MAECIFQFVLCPAESREDIGESVVRWDDNGWARAFPSLANYSNLIALRIWKEKSEGKKKLSLKERLLGLNFRDMQIRVYKDLAKKMSAYNPAYEKYTLNSLLDECFPAPFGRDGARHLVNGCWAARDYFYVTASARKGAEESMGNGLLKLRQYAQKKYGETLNFNCILNNHYESP